MKFQKKLIITVFAIPLLIFSLQTIPHAWQNGISIAKADDHKDKKYDKHDDDEHEYEENDDDDKEYEEKNDDSYSTPAKVQPTIQSPTWNQWTRAVTSSKNEAIPFTQEKTVWLADGKKENISVKAFPQNGQIYVPIETSAAFLDAHVILYPKKEFVEVIKNGETVKQLTFKRDTITSFENGQKVPLPAPMIEKDGEFWIPISVLANGLGYQVNDSNDIFTFQMEGR